MTRQKRVEILVVGNELLNGTTLDTNSFWLSNELVKAGFKVERKTTVRDELPAIASSFKECVARRPDWIFSLGGLGPTYDDMTVHGLALSLGRKMKLDPEAVGMLKESYKRRARLFNRPARRLTKTSMKMATTPEGSTPLQNPVGSAPGVLVKVGTTKIVSLPGVPSEMKGIFSREVLPILNKESPFATAEEWIEIVGVSESQLSPVVSRLYKEYKQLLNVKSHPRGFRNGRSVIHIQIILTCPIEEKKAGLIRLKRAIRALAQSGRNLGAKVSKLKSIR